jgi:hypothetical protein
MSDVTEGDPMIEAAQPAEYLAQDEELEDPAGLFRGLLVAIAVSVPFWAGLIWTLAKIR